MDWVDIPQKAKPLLKKYAYVLILLLVGVFLMLLPGEEKQTQEPVTVKPVSTETEDLTARLEGILSRVEGAGKVKLLLTQAMGERTIYQTDEDADTTDAGTSVKRETVIVSDGTRGESGLVQQIIGPVYLGAVVVCQGADRPSVRLAMIEAVSSATGLKSNEITVLKMK